MRVGKQNIFDRSKGKELIPSGLAGKIAQRFDLQVLDIGQSSADWQKIEVGLKGYDLTDIRVDLEDIWSHFWNLHEQVKKSILLQKFRCHIRSLTIWLCYKMTFLPFLHAHDSNSILVL